MRLARLAIVIAAALATAPAGAFEETGSVVADALLRTLEASGYTQVATGDVSRANGDTILAGLTAVTAEEGRELAIDRVVIERGFVDADNALVAERVAYETVSVEAGRDGTSTIERIVLDGVRFSGGNGAGLAGLLGTFDTLSMSGIETAARGGSSVTVDAVSAAVEERDTRRAIGGRVAVTGLTFDVALWEEPLEGRLRTLGYDTLSLDLVAAGRWEAATGAADVRELTLAGEGLGTLSLSARARGLKPATIGAIRESLDNVQGLLKELQAISFSSFTLAYDDAGLADRLIDRAARDADTDRAALAEGLAGSAAALVGAFGDGAFIADVRETVQSFLTRPGTLTVSAAPQEPVSAAEVLAASLMRPALLPRLLGLDLTAAP